MSVLSFSRASSMRFSAGLLVAVFLTSIIAAPPAKAQLQKEDFTIRLAGTTTFSNSPSSLSDKYSFGRGLNAGVGVYVTPSIDVQTSVEYLRYTLNSDPQLQSPLLRPNLNIGEGKTIIGGGNVTRFGVSAGLKWTLSRSASFRTYLRGLGHLSKITRHKYFLESGTYDFPQEARRLGTHSQIATGFSVGLGFLFPLSYTTAVFIEPVYSNRYATSQTLQVFDVRAGVLLGEF